MRGSPGKIEKEKVQYEEKKKTHGQSKHNKSNCFGN